MQRASLPRCSPSECRVPRVHPCANRHMPTILLTPTHVHNTCPRFPSPTMCKQDSTANSSTCQLSSGFHPCSQHLCASPGPSKCTQTCRLFFWDQSMFTALCRAPKMHLLLSPPPSPLTTPPPRRPDKYYVEGDVYLVCNTLRFLDVLPVLHVECNVASCARVFRTSLPPCTPSVS